MTVKFTWTIKDSNGVRATGKSPTITIQRDSDNYYWNGTTYQLAEISNAMTEQGKGVYYFDYTSTLQDLYIFFDEVTIPRYSECFYSIWDLLKRIDGLNRLVEDKVLDDKKRLISCKWKLSNTDDFSSPIVTMNITITYEGTKQDSKTWKAVEE